MAARTPTTPSAPHEATAAEPRQEGRWRLGAAALYLLAGLYALYPAWLSPGHGVVGDWRHPDMISNHWLYRWIAQRLLSGQGILHNPDYYLPVGDAPWLAGNGSDAIPATALSLLLPWPFTVTVWCLLTVVLNGLGGLALARSLGARRAGAVAAGLLAAMSPYVAYEMSGMRLAQAPLYWMLFFLAAWLRLLDAPSAKRGLWAGLLYGAAAFTYWYYGLWAALVGGVLFLLSPRWRALRVFVPVALATTLPFLTLFLLHWSAIPGTVEAAFPHPLALRSSLWPGWPLINGTGPAPALALPLLLLGLAGWGWLRAMPEPGVARRRWMGLAVLACVFYLLSLGPELQSPAGVGTGVPAPYLLAYGGVGMLQRFWWPYRHAVMVTLLLLPFAAAGFDAVAQRLQARWRLALWLLLPALALLLPLELRLRGTGVAVQSSYWETPEPYAALADMEGEALVELPLAPALAQNQQTLSYQWVHGKRLLNGHAMWVDRVRPDAWDAFVADNSLLAGLQAYELGLAGSELHIEPADIGALEDQGLRYVVVNAEYLPGKLIGLVPRYERLLGALFGEPVLSWHGALMAWDLQAYTGATTVAVSPFEPLEENLSTDGTNLAEVGSIHSLGWRPLDRSFPPAWPEDEPSWEQTLETMPPMLRKKLERQGLGPDIHRDVPDEVTP
jgi:hypothetical protein